jgi:hypothetical protein
MGIFITEVHTPKDIYQPELNYIRDTKDVYKGKKLKYKTLAKYKSMKNKPATGIISI